MKDYVFFDLDGTLTDSQEGILKSLQKGLDIFGIKRTPEQLKIFIGPPLFDTYMNGFGMNREDAEKAVKGFRSYFETKGLFENKVYPGIEDLLKKLKAAGKHLVVATSKPEAFSVRILNHFNLSGYFDFICGSTMDETRTNKAEVIAYAIQTCGLGENDKNRIIMVGDRKNDIDGAHKNGLKAAGILYGYGDRAEMEACGADFIIESVEELGNFLCRN